jgi:hypothetical protein
MSGRAGAAYPLLAFGVILVLLAGCASYALSQNNFPTLYVFFFAQTAFYVVAAWLVLTRLKHARPETHVAAILAVGLLMRLLMLPAPPISSDVFRYVWDGHVQAAGINPYLYVPADDALSGLRESLPIYPAITGGHDLQTIYPPAAQVIFLLVTRISETVFAMKAAMVAFDMVSIWAILQLLAARGLPRRRVLLYAWHPLPIWEFAGSGHVDAIAIAFFLLAIVAADRDSRGFAGIALAATALIKFFPVVLGPALYRRWDWRLPIAFLLTVVCLYLPYVGIGTSVLGSLPEYISKGGLMNGDGLYIWLVLDTLFTMPSDAFPYYFPAAAFVMLLIGLICVFRPSEKRTTIFGAMILATAFTLLFSPHHAWYFAWLVPFLCFYPLAGLIYLTNACICLYLSAWPPSLAVGTLLYVPSLVAIAGELLLRRYVSESGENRLLGVERHPD